MWRSDETLAAGTGRSGAHVHVDCDSSFQLRSGRALYTIDGEERVLEVGERVVIPAGTPHVDPYTEPGRKPSCKTMEPGRDFAYRYGRTLGSALAAGASTSSTSCPGFLMVVLRATRAETYGWARRV